MLFARRPHACESCARIPVRHSIPMPPPSSLAIALGKPSTLSLGSSPYTPSDRRAQRQARSNSLWAATATTNGFPCRIQDIPTYTHDIIKGGLRPHELVWRNAYDWLQREGYKLRPRYDPRWVPSWVVSTGLNWYYCEDGRASRVRASPFSLYPVALSEMVPG